MPSDAKMTAQEVAALGYAGDVSPGEAFAWWQSGDAVLVDIRTDAEREKQAPPERHAPGPPDQQDGRDRSGGGQGQRDIAHVDQFHAISPVRPAW